MYYINIKYLKNLILEEKNINTIVYYIQYSNGFVKMNLKKELKLCVDNYLNLMLID